MDAQLKAKWIEALRSGEFKQTHETLRDENGHCCLGVLCEVAGLDIRDDGGGIGKDNDMGSFSSYQPIFDLVGDYRESHALSMRNDGLVGDHKWSFSEIADYIEASL